MLLDRHTKFGHLVYVLAWFAWVNLFDCASAQDSGDYLHFTSGVTNPAPVPGQPFEVTWAGGQPSTTIYILLHYQFPNTPNQNIDYGTTDILSNAPNNGSWTWNIPSNIQAGRYRLSIGENPFLQAGSTEIFTFLPSQTSDLPPGTPVSQSTRTDHQTFNGCGLPPLPDFTYTAYQPPCTVTTDGIVTTLYPIVPVDASSSFWASEGWTAPSNTNAAAAITTSPITSTTPPTTTPTTIASGIYAQALQCPYTVTPAATTATISGTQTVFSTVSCGTRRALFPAGVACHATGFTTFPVTGSTTVCCPSGWSTTPLATDLYCFTSLPAAAQATQPALAPRQDAAPVTITDRLFAAAGLVTANEHATTTSDVQSTHTTKPSPGTKLSSNIWSVLIALVVTRFLALDL